MNELIAKLAAPKRPDDYKAAIDLLLNEIVRLEGQMKYDRAEIERLRAESNAITRHTDVVLGRLRQQIEALGRLA